MFLVYVAAGVLVVTEKAPLQKHIENLGKLVRYNLITYRNTGRLSFETSDLADLDYRTIDTFWEIVKQKTIPMDDFLYDYAAGSTAGLPGGYIVEVPALDLFLISSGKGDLYSFNPKDFSIGVVDSNFRKIFDRQNYGGKIIKGLRGRFGVRDLFYDAETQEVLASLFVDITGDGCYGIGLFSAQIFNPLSTGLDFKKVFETKACNRNFNGHASGGRIAKLQNDYIMTIGSFDMNLYGDPSIPQNPKSAVGKVISIKSDKTFEVLSMGHRNQQGLAVVDGQIIITEHGPMGGDEINLIHGRRHYGWPYYAYGYDYDYNAKHNFPHGINYEKPAFYFSPSIGISELVFYQGKEFPNWRNKFLVSSLKDKSLFLIDYDKVNKRFISYERVEIGHRIRDIAVGKSGKIFLITDDQKLIVLSKLNVETANNRKVIKINPPKCTPELLDSKFQLCD